MKSSTINPKDTMMFIVFFIVMVAIIGSFESPDLMLDFMP